ncbi:hypothetical protein [Nitrospirillum viridazoti]|uniref:Uncharacterized protein n=1 Tax=Nitrospirillum amazonense TaxID=28077 RepID=A0A560J5A3_9PROT|nr:hypothetical protein [Nitrospirillum amazonense]TWB64414.1 hypothetical protein FBZ92_101310 [Nitrospirillum amazonense]
MTDNHPAERQDPAGAPEVAAIDQETQEVIDELSGEFLTVAADAAARDGWPEELIEPLTLIALEPFLDSVLGGGDPDQAFEQAMAEAHARMFEEIFTSAQDDGETLADAFLCMLLLDRTLAEGRGEPEVKYPEVWVEAALAAVYEEAERGSDPGRQIGAGFDALAAAARAAA